MTDNVDHLYNGQDTQPRTPYPITPENTPGPYRARVHHKNGSPNVSPLSRPPPLLSPPPHFDPPPTESYEERAQAYAGPYQAPPPSHNSQAIHGAQNFRNSPTSSAPNQGRARASLPSQQQPVQPPMPHNLNRTASFSTRADAGSSQQSQQSQHSTRATYSQQDAAYASFYPAAFPPPPPLPPQPPTLPNFQPHQGQDYAYRYSYDQRYADSDSRDPRPVYTTPNYNNHVNETYRENSHTRTNQSHQQPRFERRSTRRSSSLSSHSSSSRSRSRHGHRRTSRHHDDYSTSSAPRPRRSHRHLRESDRRDSGRDYLGGTSSGDRGHHGAMLGGASGALLGHELGGEDLVTTLGAMLLGTAAGYYGEKVLGQRRSKLDMRDARGGGGHSFEHRQYRSSADIREQARLREKERAREAEERDRLRAAKRNGSRHRSESRHRRRRGEYDEEYYRSAGSGEEEAARFSRRGTTTTPRPPREADPSSSFYPSSGPGSPRDNTNAYTYPYPSYPSLRRERSVRFNDETSSTASRRRKSRQREDSRRRSRRGYGRREASSDED